MLKNIAKLSFVLVSTAGLFFDCSCTNSKPEQQKTPTEPDSNIPRQTPNPPKPNNAALTNFLATPVAEANGLTFDIKMTNHYHGSIPPAAVLLDYNSKGNRKTPLLSASATIPQAFESHLPQSVKDALQSHNLLGKGVVDIRWVVQSNATLGEKADHNGVPTTTRIAAHGWADPDAPASYTGPRVDRQFLQGIFVTQKDISTNKLPLGQLISTQISVHDNLFSPRIETDLIKLGANDEAQAFWIVVIDHQNPSGQIKALANLIWVLDIAKSEQLYNLSFDASSAPSVKTFGELLAKLNASADFQGWHGLNLLNDLLK